MQKLCISQAKHTSKTATIVLYLNINIFNIIIYVNYSAIIIKYYVFIVK